MRANFGTSAPNRRVSPLLLLAIVLLSLFAATLPAAAAKGGNTTSGGCKPRNACATKDTTDTAAPTVTIGQPSSGATVAGTVSVTGTSADNVAVASVEISIDGGTYQPASGTASWSRSLDTTTLADGAHTVTARATDTSGNRATTSVSFTVKNTVEQPADTQAPTLTVSNPANGTTVSGPLGVTGTAADNTQVAKVEVRVDGGSWMAASGTSSWSRSLDTASYPDGDHTITARVTDAHGNATAKSRSVTFDNTPEPTPPPTTTAPNTQGTWTSPEGVTIEVSSAGPWTISQIYTMLKANAVDLDKTAPTLTVKVQDTYASQATTSAGKSGDRYTTFSAIMYLKGVSSTFASSPDSILAHEYGHVWSDYHLYLSQQRDWTGYIGARNFENETRLDTSYTWDRREILAEDYRLLFGSSTAISQRPQHMNSYIADPRNVTGLRDYLFGPWRTPR